MGLFDLFQLFKKKEEPIDIWETEEPNELVMGVLEQLEEKCDYGENIDALNEQERIFYITQTLEAEVNNGGFSQFFYNSSGDFSNEVVNAFETILAYHTAGICQKAIYAFGCEIPVDRDEREELLDKIEENNERFCEILEECDDAFYDYKDDLEKLNYEYLLRYKEFFQS